MDVLKLQNRIRAYKYANSFNTKKITTKPISIPYTTILNTSVLLYPNAAIIINPKSVNITLKIVSTLAANNTLSFVYSQNIIANILQNKRKYQKVYKNITLISKAPNIAIPLIKECISIYCPNQLVPLYNHLFPQENKQFLF